MLAYDGHVSTYNVYRIYADADQLLYVGVASTLEDRLKDHRSKWWGRYIERVEVEDYETREAALTAERIAILAEHPMYNTIYNANGAKPPERHRAEFVARMHDQDEGRVTLTETVSHLEEALEDRDSCIVELRKLGVGPTELARLAKMSRSGIDNLLKRKG